MHACTRRAFMKGGALGLARRRPRRRSALPRARRARARRRAAAPKVLIAVFQRGAVDGLSMVVPHGDADYYAARGSIAIARPAAGSDDAALDLDGFFGLHPVAGAAPAALGRAAARRGPCLRLPGHHPLALRRAGLHGVGHARRQEHCRRLARARAAGHAAAAAPRRSARWPWARSCRACSAGTAGAVAMSSIADFDVRAEAGRDAGRGGRAPRLRVACTSAGVRDLLHGTGRETFEAVKMLRRAQPAAAWRRPTARSTRADASATACGRSPSSFGPTSALEVAFADTGGWDTHAAQGDERGQLANRLTDFAQGLAALDRDLGDRMARRGGPHHVGVRPHRSRERQPRHRSRPRDRHAGAGRAGAWRQGATGAGRASARDQLFEGRDLAVTTDFRELFAEVARRHLGDSRRRRRSSPASPPGPGGHPGALA